MKRMIKGALFSVAILSNPVYADDARDGEAIYNKHCVACHQGDIAKALKSPLVHDSAQWQPYFDEALKAAIAADASIADASDEQKKAAMMAELLKIIKTGTAKGMPPMGTCMDCSDEEFIKAVEFMSTPQ